MKRCYKNISFICLIALVLSSFIFAFGAENNLDICDHNYKYSYTDNDCFVYICAECDNVEQESITNVQKKWNIQAVNESVKLIDNGYLLDVVPDGIINAKDFAKIQHTYRYGY